MLMEKLKLLRASTLQDIRHVAAGRYLKLFT
jgi:hypothetical protein